MKLLIVFLTMGCLAAGQGANGAGGGRGGAQQQNSSSNQTSNNSASPSGSPNGAPSGSGITGGGVLPIESTLFAYKALAADASAIANQVASMKPGIVVVTGQNDAGTLLQWRTVMGQLKLLTDRAASKSALENIQIPKYSMPAPQPTPPASNQMVPFFITSPTDVQTLAQTAQTLASSFAVNENLTAAQGAIGDTPLLAMVADDLQTRDITVYIPSVYPPNLLKYSDLSGSILLGRLSKLEDERKQIGTDIQNYLRALDDATTISAGGGGYTNDDVMKAKAFMGETNTIKSLVSSLTALVAAIDTFEGTLFTGQSPSSTAANTGNNTPNNPNGAPSALTPSMAQLNSNPAGGTTLQQILVGDLLARQIWGIDNPSDAELAQILPKIRVLSLHALESGGGSLTKSNLFTGTKVYFGGGSVATFSLFGVDGSIQCSGYAYDYSGYVRDKDFEGNLRAPKATAAIVNNCVAQAQPTGQNRKGARTK
jgi:hypothetical protein